MFAGAQGDDARGCFTGMLINTRGFVSDSRFAELETELAANHCDNWDVVFLNETWRDVNEEIFALDSGHIWFGSGGAKGKH